MNYKIERKLKDFLDKKLKEIVEETANDNPRFNKLHIEKKGFEMAKRRGGYDLSNNDFQSVIGYQNSGERSFSLKIDGIFTSVKRSGTVGTLYRCMDEIDEITKELGQLKNDVVIQEKVDEIAKNSINTWLKAVLQNQPYSYYTTESAKKITLSIKLKNRVQLDIPIYFSKFQKIMPELLNTIQQFEKTANEAKIKVLISNSKVNQQWKTQ